MAPTKKPVYKSPKAGQSLITTIASGCVTPLLEVKYSNLIKPFYYPNSPKIPRYSITCISDPKEHKEFLDGILSIEKNEKVETVIKNDTVRKNNDIVNSGKACVKFQGKEKIPIYLIEDGKEIEIQLEDEFAQGEKICVFYDIMRYTKKNISQEPEYGLNFKPIKIYFYPSEN